MPLKYIKNLDKQLFKQLKEASKNPHPVVFVTVFTQFFLVVMIGFFGVTLAAGVAGWFIFGPAFGNLGTTCYNKVKHIAYKANPANSKDIAWIQERMLALEHIALQNIDDKFWSRNEKQYNHDLINYRGVLYFIQDESVVKENMEYGPSTQIDKMYLYSFTICPMNDDATPCLKIANKYDDPNVTYPGDSSVFFNIDSDEVIQSLTIEPHQIAGIDGYAYIGEVKTNKRTQPLLVYPSGTDPNLYYAVLEVLQDVNSTIEFEEDLDNGVRFRVETPEFKENPDAMFDTSLPEPMYFVDLQLSEDGTLSYITTIDPDYLNQGATNTTEIMEYEEDLAQYNMDAEMTEAPSY